MRDEFTSAIRSNQAAFGVDLSDEVIERLAEYYELVQQHNPLLHLVAPCSPAEFATRHVLESLTMLEFLPQAARLADVGSGAGLPSIPCLIARRDLYGLLIESKEKKARFLNNAVSICGIESRGSVVHGQFVEISRPDVEYVTCRALDKFTEHLARLLKWAGDCGLLLFGGQNLRDELIKSGRSFQEKLMPGSRQRFLFVSQPGS